MATWKRLTDVEKSDMEIDLDTIAFMRRNGNGTDITFDTGQTLTVRESPEETGICGNRDHHFENETRENAVLTTGITQDRAITPEQANPFVNMICGPLAAQYRA
jgi:hypothetical protein